MMEQQIPQNDVRPTGRGIFLLVLTLGGTLLTLGVYQVPQPWRGWLVAWLLFMGTLGVLILRFLRHYFQYKTVQIATRPQVAHRTAPQKRALPSSDGLKVVMMDPSKGGRRVLR